MFPDCNIYIFISLRIIFLGVGLTEYLMAIYQMIFFFYQRMTSDLLNLFLQFNSFLFYSLSI